MGETNGGLWGINMEDELLLQYGNLTLTKKEQEKVVIGVGEVEETDLLRGRHCLIEKVISKKLVPFYVFENTMHKI